ncbi:unnamed protein product [Orchesella dallaii]|uniref:YqaJ viral recombinase domain-containing protein n=1 Tax=Orchesella dallaii TaxID=48710 RepID=A0ABP1R284_9HEXA
MSEVQLIVLGYICINPEDKDDFRVFTDLNEFINTCEKKMGEVENSLSTPVDITTLPIVDKSLLTKKNLTFPLQLNESNDANSKDYTSFIEWKLKPIETFRLGFPQFDEELRKKYPTAVSTTRKMLKDFLYRLAVKNGQKNAPTEWDLTNYHVDYVLFNDEEEFQSLNLRPEADWLQKKFENLGLDVESYLTKRQGGGTRYEVYSIHALVHLQSKIHIVYAAQVDGFFYDEKSKNLTPVEIKCLQVKNYAPNVEPAFLQARLGKVECMIFANYYNKCKDSKGVWRWTVRDFKQSYVPNSDTFPEYGNDHIFLLCKLLECNKNVPSILTIMQNADGEIQNVCFFVGRILCCSYIK